MRGLFSFQLYSSLCTATFYIECVLYIECVAHTDCFRSLLLTLHRSRLATPLARQWRVEISACHRLYSHHSFHGLNARAAHHSKSFARPSPPPATAITISSPCTACTINCRSKIRARLAPPLPLQGLVGKKVNLGDSRC
jgi:hypothetical protein